jgi:hypothetical protein
MLGRQKVQIDRESLLDKIKRLRDRISSWCKINGYENMGNTNETRNNAGEIVWKRSDWEYVDDTHKQIINNESYKPYSATLIKMNALWKKYNVH